ncbi:MAG: RNA polymerase factor sigma-54 [Proteobacteria bacterium]|nr:RNA polymerase factor sigma-54 [Pseudomonadota bacterium]
MALELRQQLKLTQQLVMTPQLQQAIKLLQLSRLELVDAINQEIEENPALEELAEHSTKELSDDSTDAEDLRNADSVNETEVKIEEKLNTEIDWDNYIEEYNSTGKTHYESEHRDAPSFESFISEKKSLNDHLLWQLLMFLPSDYEKELGCLIIGNLDKDGYLLATIEELVQMSEYPMDMVEEVLETLQSFDPPGVCARSLSECLLIQAKQLKIDDPILTRIITHHIKDLENKNYKAIARALKIPITSVQAAVTVIQGFESKPGRIFSDEEPHYIIPDIFVYKEEGEFVIVLNDDGMPKLRVNPYYRKAISQGTEMTGDTKEYLQEKMRSAAWLIKSIHQRQKTIYNVMESILKFQSEFFEKGIAYLKPMVLRDVAQDISMHESTISRVTTNKYAFTPQGIFELKYFFNSSINRGHGESAIASISVHEKIKQIIEKENPKKPYSDDKIALMLKEEANIDIARRTVAKYREALRILPSSKRKQF